MSLIQEDETRAEAHVVTVDADAHVIETDHTWDFMSGDDAQYRPKSVVIDGDPPEAYWMINGRIAGFRLPTLTEKQRDERSRLAGRSLQSTSAAVEMSDVGLRLDGMDQLGIDLQVLHNSLWIEATTDVPEVEAALCRSWNRWMAELFEQGRRRLFWTCVVPAFDHRTAVEEMRFARAHGAVAVCLRPFEGPFIVTDPEFDPLLRSAADLDMAVAIHIANGSPDLVRLLRTRYPSGGGWAPFRIPTVIAAMSLITSGVSQRFPTIRWGIIEASSSWVPWICREIQRRTGVPNTPDDNPFVNNRIYVTAQVDDDIPYVVDHVGPSVLMIGTDYGHTDASSEYDAVLKLRNLPLDPAAKEGLLARNAAALYGLQERVDEIGRRGTETA